MFCLSHPYVHVALAIILNPSWQSLHQYPVQIDPHVASRLRPHQRQGIQFLYDCIMGNRMKGCNGAILADEVR